MFPREVFAVPEEALIAVSVTAGINGLLLRIIDNDTGEQVPTVANKPKPYTYKPNKVRLLHIFFRFNEQVFCSPRRTIIKSSILAGPGI